MKTPPYLPRARDEMPRALDSCVAPSRRMMRMKPGLRSPRSPAIQWYGECVRRSNMKRAVHVAAAAMVLVACGGSNKPAEGPAEKAGASIDQTADEASDNAHELKEDAKDKADDVKEKATPEKGGADDTTD